MREIKVTEIYIIDFSYRFEFSIDENDYVLDVCYERIGELDINYYSDFFDETSNLYKININNEFDIKIIDKKIVSDDLHLFGEIDINNSHNWVDTDDFIFDELNEDCVLVIDKAMLDKANSELSEEIKDTLNEYYIDN